MLRVTGTLHEPNTWTVGVLLVTGVLLLARHPIARLIGTETDSVAPPVVATTPVSHPQSLVQAPSLALSAPVPTHAPRDPFRALVSAGGKVLAAGAAPAVAAAAPAAVTPVTTAPAPAAPTTSASSTSCSGATHRVVSGDTLWTIAARAVRTTDSDRVTIAWHRIYAANRDSLGSNPSLLRVGESICLPSSI